MPDTIDCKICGQVCTFSDLLSDSNTHSAEALTIHDKDSSRWHSLHQVKTQSISHSLSKTTEQGTRPQSMAQKLAHIAARCKACHPQTDHVVRGWYDAPLLVSLLLHTSLLMNRNRNLRMTRVMPLVNRSTPLQGENGRWTKITQKGLNDLSASERSSLW